MNRDYLISISDTHIGAKNSRFRRERIRAAFENALPRVKHAVLNGDIFELLEPYHQNKKALDRAVAEARDQLERWIESAPNCQFHFVLGNHENVHEFRRLLDELHEAYPERFEWHPEAILIGDMLFTHGDLQQRSQTNCTRPFKPHGLDNVPGHTWLTEQFENVKLAMDWMKEKKLKAMITASKLGSELNLRARHGDNAPMHPYSLHLFFVRANGQDRVLDTTLLSRIRHICSGHTHVKFSHFEWDGKYYHNTGGVLKRFDRKRKDLGFVAAQIGADDKIHDVVAYHQYDPDKPDAYHPSKKWEAYVQLHAQGHGFGR